jgi:excisionase family DNA binding protein
VIVSTNLPDQFLKEPHHSPLEVAKMLGLSRSSVYALMGNGDLPWVRVSPRRFRIPAAAVKDYLRKQVCV